MMVLFTIIMVSTLWAVYAQRPSLYAGHAQLGYAVSPVRLGPIIVLSIRAAPVTVRALSKAEEQSPHISALQENPRLLYMGQNDGISIIYDALHQQVVRIPNTAVLIQVSNCELRSPEDTRCTLLESILQRP
jgi:hypothetical protein